MATTGRPLDLAELVDLAGPRAESLTPGDQVEVRNRFDRRWSGGFEVASIQHGGCRIRRDSDGVVLPVMFASAEVRRRRNGVGRT